MNAFEIVFLGQKFKYGYAMQLMLLSSIKSPKLHLEPDLLSSKVRQRSLRGLPLSLGTLQALQ